MAVRLTCLGVEEKECPVRVARELEVIVPKDCMCESRYQIHFYNFYNCINNDHTMVQRAWRSIPHVRSVVAYSYVRLCELFFLGVIKKRERVDNVLEDSIHPRQRVMREHIFIAREVPVSNLECWGWMSNWWQR